MSSPVLPTLSLQMLALLRERFQRCQAMPDLGRTLIGHAMASFPPFPGWEAAAAALLASILAAKPRVEHVILVPSRDLWLVVDEASLAQALPPETTIRLYFGQPGRMDESAIYPTFDVRQCLPLLLRLLEALDPLSVYVRGSAQFRTQHLGAAVKASRPGLFLTFEVYDYAGMFDDDNLACWGFTPETTEVNRNAEVYLGLHADFIIDKTPGEEWVAAARELLTPPRQSYFPTLGSRYRPALPLRPHQPGRYRVLCAGSMPYFQNYCPGEGFPHWSYQNIIEPVRTLAGEADCQVDLFNASHDPLLDHWPAFGGYAGLFPPDRVGYHPRIPVAEVMERIPGYDFGMFFFQASVVPIDYPLQQSLPNRCMSYICGDLPIIVNREMRHIGALVEHFHAGIVLASTEVAELPGRIRAADLQAMRAGAAAMHRHLVQRNQEALQAFRACLSDHQQRVR